MKVRFLGTSHGLSENGRFRTSTLLDVDGKVYIIDAGAPVYELLIGLGYELEDVAAVFLTHAHGDHTLGLLSLLQVANGKNFKNVKFDVYVTTEELKNAFECVIKAVSNNQLDSSRISLKIYDESSVYTDERLKASFTKTRHYLYSKKENEPSYAVNIESNGKTVVFSGDLSWKLEGNDFPQIIKDKTVDLFVLEFAHFTIDDALPHLAKCRAKRVAFNHVNSERNAYGEIIKSLSGMSFKTYVVNDGDEIII